ncbi:uncharacterized protein LOC119660096 [Hermetia illucens]|uniref:uncharacterized protein LOC119660096 n=1 Tax=Hermetia illucens TaxID=343691 RepID=UPI0018CC227D|nr:uncharacterized protein LOC119660096 [Hermetia illucens]
MLIMEVESRQCLYAKDKEDYKNKTKREDAWKDISSILNRSVSECQSKWNILRDSFRGYYHSLCNTPSGSGATETVKWAHFKAMMFLIPYIRVPEDDCGNYSNNSPELSANTILQREDNSHDSEYHQPGNLFANNNSKRKRDCFDESLEKVLQAIENTTTKKSIESFFESIIETIDSLPKIRLLEFQMDVLELICNKYTDA